MSSRKASRARSLMLELLEEAHGLARGPVSGGFADLRSRWLAHGSQPVLPLLLYGWNLNAPVVFLAPAPDPVLAEFAPRLLPGGRAADALDPYLCYCAETFDRARRHGLLGTPRPRGAWCPARAWNRAESLLQEWLGDDARLGSHGLWLHAMPYIVAGDVPLAPDVREQFAARVQSALDLIRPALVVEVRQDSDWLVRQRGASEDLAGQPMEQTFPVLGRLPDPDCRDMAAAVSRRLRRPADANDLLYALAVTQQGETTSTAAN